MRGKYLTVNRNTATHKKIEYWCVEIASFKRMHTIVDSLNVYPLLTSKRNDFDSFKSAFSMTLTDDHLTSEYKNTILELKNGMNNKRTVYDWSHLNEIKCPLEYNLFYRTGLIVKKISLR